MYIYITKIDAVPVILTAFISVYFFYYLKGEILEIIYVPSVSIYKI